MPQEFSSVTGLLAHLQTPAGKAAECYYKIGPASAELATRIERATGLNVVGFALALDRSGILHTSAGSQAADAGYDV